MLHFITDVLSIFHLFSEQTEAIQSGLVSADVSLLHGMGICFDFKRYVSSLNKLVQFDRKRLCILIAEGKKRVDVYLRKLLNGNNEERPKPKLFTLNRGQMFPEKMCFMDYRFDEIDTWWPWSKADDASIAPDTPVDSILIATKETSYISTWFKVCIEKAIPLMLIGNSGTGKSATAMNSIRGMPKEKYLSNIIHFSARTQAQQVYIRSV